MKPLYKTRTALICCVVTLLQSCTQTTKPPSQPEPAAIIWNLDNTKSIGGNAPEVLGSPQIVQTPYGPGMHFNGSSDGLVFSVDPLKGLSQFTIEALFKPELGGTEEQRFMHIEDTAGGRCMMEIRLIQNNWALDTFLLSGPSQRAQLDRTMLHPADRWTWVALVYGDGKMTSYIDGKAELSGPVDVKPMVDGKISLGVRQNKVFWFKGTIQQVRFHSIALPPQNLQAVAP